MASGEGDIQTCASYSTQKVSLTRNDGKEMSSLTSSLATEVVVVDQASKDDFSDNRTIIAASLSSVKSTFTNSDVAVKEGTTETLSVTTPTVTILDPPGEIFFTRTDSSLRATETSTVIADSNPPGETKVTRTEASSCATTISDPSEDIELSRSESLPCAATTTSNATTISDLPDEIIIYQILSLLTIEEIGPIKGVCKKWRGFVRQHYRHLKKLDLTPWDFLVDEMLLIDIVKYAVHLRQLRLDRCWRAVTECAILSAAHSCRQLEVFCASRCGSLTDLAVSILVENCPQISEMDLSSCYNVTDESLCNIATHGKNMRELHVSSVYGVTDVGVSQLAFKCKNLQSLDVSYCYRVSNLGLEGFFSREEGEKLALKYLRIRDCHKVTDTTVFRLTSIGVEVNNMF